MPELPDVETFKRYLDSTALHERIEKAEVFSADLVKGISARELESVLAGRTLEETLRRGKFLLVRLDDGRFLVLHFGMTGYLEYFKEGEEPDHTRMLLAFENGYHLAYVCMRKFGELGLVEDAETFFAERDLGPDAASDELDLARFRELLDGRRGMAKSTLMNQSILAGIGNVYSDEICFQAGIHPATPVADLSKEEIEALYEAMRAVLETTIERQADPEQLPEVYLSRHRDPDASCPRCGTQIATRRISGRRAYFCPRCQPEP